MRALLFVVLLLATSLAAMPPALAVNPDEVLDDPVLEARARDLSAELRCLVCQNQSIDDSDADLARDLRLLVRERLVAGDSDAEVLDFIVDRYGEFVLLNPVMGPHTLLLWIAAPGILGIGLVVVAVALWRRRRTDASLQPELNAEERAALRALEEPPAPPRS